MIADQQSGKNSGPTLADYQNGASAIPLFCNFWLIFTNISQRRNYQIMGVDTDSVTDGSHLEVTYSIMDIVNTQHILHTLSTRLHMFLALSSLDEEPPPPLQVIVFIGTMMTMFIQVAEVIGYLVYTATHVISVGTSHLVREAQ
jgi:hypothetical protein